MDEILTQDNLTKSDAGTNTETSEIAQTVNEDESVQPDLVTEQSESDTAVAQISETDELEETAETAQISESDDTNAEQVDQIEQVENTEQVDQIEQVEQVENAEEVEQVENAEEVDQVDEAEDADDADDAEEVEEVKEEKTAFKLTLPANFEELQEKICTKRGRKLIYKPNEVIFEGTYKVLGTDKKNEEGIKIKDILDAEIKEGLKQGYLDKFDGLKTSEIKEEYENDIIYELAEQEFRKMGVIYEDGKFKVYVYDWDRKGMHHVGYIDETEASDSAQYFTDKENYSFDICGIITGGKGKRVTKDEKGKITITKEKGDPIGVELDVTILKRKD